MIILGIHDGHNASACLFKDGKIIGMTSEERFSYKKNQGGFPKLSIEWLLTSLCVEPDQIDIIAFAGLVMPVTEIVSVERKRHNLIGQAFRFFPKQIFTSDSVTKSYIKYCRRKREKLAFYSRDFDELGLDRGRARFVEHHLCHAATAYYLDERFSRERKTLILTLDGSGDGVSGTVSVGYMNRLERIAAIHSLDSLGMIYSRITMYLGMKAWEHEYKVMGMAPYSSEVLVKKSYEVLRRYIKLDKSGLLFENSSGGYGNKLLNKFQKDLVGHRFDGVCGAIQQITEELVTAWVINWVKKTGISNICLAGGVFMNVKLNMLINELNGIDSLFVMPSCGDESIALGAALNVYAQECSEKGNGQLNIEPLRHLYLGPEYSENYIEDFLEKTVGINFEKHVDINSEVVRLLVDKKIVGRLYGKMEFGARSLGNRSILAHPGSLEIVGKINRAIKMRDFWMPFAPSILNTASDRYLRSNKLKKSPFMMVAFETTELARQQLPAVLHQSDFTCRPQIVDEDTNPEYFDLISRFEKATGIGCVLNTSLNIHGYPIVNSPENAIWTLKNSELDAIQIGDFIVTKAV